MRNRLELQKKFEEIPTIKKVYFQPPSTVKMVYPCIRYTWEGVSDRKADDREYIARDRYSLMIISTNPDTPIPDLIRKTFRYCSLDRIYTADNLYHYVFTLYY